MHKDFLYNCSENLLNTSQDAIIQEIRCLIGKLANSSPIIKVNMVYNALKKNTHINNGNKRMKQVINVL